MNVNLESAQLETVADSRVICRYFDMMQTIIRIRPRRASTFEVGIVTGTLKIDTEKIVAMETKWRWSLSDNWSLQCQACLARPHLLVTNDTIILHFGAIVLSFYFVSPTEVRSFNRSDQR